MMDDQELYRTLSDVIQAQMAIFGPQIAIMKARNIHGLIVADNGKVTEIRSEPATVIMQLLTQYRELSEPVVKRTIEPQLSKYLHVN
jgi:hypothetical protein